MQPHRRPRIVAGADMRSKELLREREVSTPTTRIQQSKALNDEMLAFSRDSSAKTLTDARDKLTTWAVDYALELHASIVDLSRLGRPASAAAMLRLIMEAALTSLYILHLPDQNIAHRLEAGEEFLPDTREIYKRCIDLPVVGPNIEKISKSLKPFHKLTHGDMPQLNRRRSDANWSETFSMEEASGQLYLADLLLLAAMDSFSHAIRSPDTQTIVRMRRDSVASEVSRRFGAPMPEADDPTPSPIR